MDTELQLIVIKCAIIILGALIALTACCWIFDRLRNGDEPSTSRDDVIGLSVSTLANEARVVSSQPAINLMETGLLMPVPLAVNTPLSGWQMKTMNNQANIDDDDPPPSYQECCKK